MSRQVLSLGRVVLIAGALVLALAACGRRGPPEAPLTAEELAAVKQRQAIKAQKTGAAAEPAEAADNNDDEDTQTQTFLPSPTPTPHGSRRRGYTIPKDPFILDPLL